VNLETQLLNYLNVEGHNYTLFRNSCGT